MVDQSKKFTDALGNEWGVGDTVGWPASSYSSNYLVFGEVKKVFESGVSIAPTGSTRFKRTYDKYIDSRTGEFLPDWYNHKEKESHYRHKVTGEEVDNVWNLHWEARSQWEYVRVKYYDYVTKTEEQIPGMAVRVSLTENIILIKKGASENE